LFDRFSVVRIGRTSFSKSQLVDNVKAVLPGILTRLPEKWAAIASVALKTPKSIALPVYNAAFAEEASK
jgi:ribosome biogenesis protein UTP30